MFWSLNDEIGLSETEVLSGESDDQQAYLATIDDLAVGWAHDDRDALPPVEEITPGPYLAVILEYVDRSRLNGHDVIRLLQARERQIAHSQAGSQADCVEVSYSAPGDADSPAERIETQARFASDEIRAALTLTRRAADLRLSVATDLKERLPEVWQMLDQGLIDLSRARVFADGTCHVSDEIARSVVAQLAEIAPRLTTGQLRARIRRLCITADPKDAEKRERFAHEDRKLVIEPTVDGTANVHLFDIKLADARAIGRRVNGHMVSFKREDRSGRTHDQLRTDIALDLLLGSDRTTSRGTIEMRVDLATLAGLDENPAEIPGLGPVVADIARQVADESHRAEWRVVVTDDAGQVVNVGTTRRRPTKALSRFVDATQPTCTFPGCVAPAADCDYDHLTPWAEGGETANENLSPKCRHDHRLKDHDWTHVKVDDQDQWTSPLGHTYISQGQSP